MLLPWLLWSCATYYFNGERYGSQDTALAAQQKLYEDILARITPLPATVGDYALIGIPNREVLHERGVIGGVPSSRAWGVTVLVRDYLLVAKALEKRAVFKRVMVQWTGGDHLNAPRGGIALYVLIPSKTAAGWYFKGPGSAPVPVFFETGNPDMAARVTYFLDSVARLAAQR